jgi:hypothetical protein
MIIYNKKRTRGNIKMKHISKNINFLAAGMLAVTVFFDEIPARVMLLSLLTVWGIFNFISYFMPKEAKSKSKAANTVTRTAYVKHIRGVTVNPRRKTNAVRTKNGGRTGIYVTRRKYRNRSAGIKSER